MSPVLALSAAAAIASSTAAAFLFAYAGYRPFREWIAASSEKDALQFQRWTNSLFMGWSAEKAEKIARITHLCIFGIAILILVAAGSFLFAAAAAAVVYWIPRVIYRVAREKRRKRFEEQLPDAISAMVLSVRAGNSLSFAIEEVGRRFSGPVAQEFGLIAREHSGSGLSIEDALARARDRLRTENFTMVSTAMIINVSQGGDLLHILERMADAIRALSNLKKKIVVETSEIRAQEKVVLIMTPLFAVLVCLFDPSILDVLLHSLAGNILLVVVVGLQVSCVMWIRRIVKTTV